MKRKIILLLFLVMTSVSFSQDTTSIDKPTVVIQEFHLNGTLKVQKYFNNSDYSQLEKYLEYYNNGQLRLLAKFKNSKLHNELTTFWKNGNLKRKDLYRKGILVEGKCWDPNGNEIEYTEFEISSEMREG